MRRATASTVIHRPVNDVFARVTDVENWMAWHWDWSWKVVQKMSDDPPGVGTTYSTTINVQISESATFSSALSVVSDVIDAADALSGDPTGRRSGGPVRSRPVHDEAHTFKIVEIAEYEPESKVSFNHLAKDYPCTETFTFEPVEGSVKVTCVEVMQPHGVKESVLHCGVFGDKRKIKESLAQLKRLLAG